MKDQFIDIHCHPTLKPFGKSFYSNTTRGQNSIDPSYYKSIWRRDQPKKKQLDKLLHKLLTVTKFTQADFSTLIRGKAKLVIIALGPMELGFVNHSLKNTFFAEGLANFATGIGEKRVNYLQDDLQDYFKDLNLEYKYLEQLHEKPVKLGNETCTYKIINTMNEYDEDVENVIHIVLSFEGGHVFNTGLKLVNRPIANKDEVLENIRIVKNEWGFKPFFVTLTHHFPNELCGQAKSFKGLLSKLYNQETDIELEITE